MATRDEILRFLIEVSGEQGIEKLQAALAELGNESERGETQAADLVKRLDKLTEAARGSAEFVRLQQAVAETSDELKRAQEGLTALNREFDSTDKSSKKVTQAFARAEREVERLTKRQQEQSEALQRVTTQLTKAGVDVGKLAQEEARLREEAAKASRELETQGARLAYAREAAERNARALEAMGDAFGRLRSQIGDAGERLLKIGAAATAAAAALAVYKAGQFFTGSIEAASDFQDAIARISAATGATTEDINRLSEAAREAGSSTVFTAAQAAEGLEILSKAGLDASESIAALPQVLAIAQGQSIGMAEAAGLVTDAVGIMGLSFEESGRAADVLSKGANLSNTTITQLGNALSVAGPLAKAAGLDIEQTVAILDSLAEAGIRGEKAGTGLRNVLGQLADPSSKARKALAELGIQGNDLETVLDGLQGAGARAEKAILAFGTEAGPTLRTLVDRGSEGLKNYERQLRAAGGSAEAAAKRIDQTLTGAVKGVESAFEALRIALVEPLLDPLQEELGTLATTLRDLAASSEFESVRQSVAAIFQSGLVALREFLGELDLEEASGRIAKFAETAKTDIAAALSTIGEVIDAVRAFARGMDVLINAVQTGIFALAAAVTKLGQAGAELVSFQATVLDTIDVFGLWQKALGVDFAKAAASAEERAGGLGAVFDEFARRTVANANETREALEGFSEGAEASAQTSQDAAAVVVESLQSVESVLDDSGAAAADFEASFNQAAESVAEDATKLTEAVGGAGQGLNDLIDANAAAARALAEAVEAGAAPEEIERLQTTFDESTAKVNAYEKTLKSTQKQAESTGKAQQQLGTQTAEAGRQARSASEDAKKLDSSLQDISNTTVGLRISLGEVSQEFVKASEDIADFFFKVGGSISQYSRARESLVQELTDQRTAVDEYVASLDKELARYDPMEQALERLRSQYNFVDDARLREIAQREQRLKQLQDSAQDAERDLFNASRLFDEQVAQQDNRLDRREEQIRREQEDLQRQRETARDPRRIDLRVEVVAVNNQRTGDQLIAEISEQALDQLASRILDRIRRDLDGML